MSRFAKYPIHAEQLLINICDVCTRLPNALEYLSDLRPGGYAGIIIFRHRQHANDILYSRLMENGVVCALRGGGIRFSPHYDLRHQQLLAALTLAAA